MSKTVLIAGAKGRFGRTALQAFQNAGWQVRAFARNVSQDTFPDDVKVCVGNAQDVESLSAAAQGCDVIVNALHPPYEHWTRDIPSLTASVLTAAKSSGATVIIPGNIYNYGEDMPTVLRENTPHKPTTHKGQLRVDMETAYREAADKGVQTIILRAGDFIEREKTGNWFDSYMTTKISQGKITYPGPLDRVHAWAYLPDMGRAIVGLAEKRAELSAFEDIGFPGFSVTGADLVAAIERIIGRSLKVSGIPWPLLRVMGLFIPNMREVHEMRYLWSVPHQMDGSKLKRILPDFEATPLETALADAV